MKNWPQEVCDYLCVCVCVCVCFQCCINEGGTLTICVWLA